MSPFRAKGDLPEWRLIYDVLAGLAVGDVVEYDTLDDALGRPFRANRHPLDRAVRQLLDIDRRTVEVMRGKGYRVVEAREHERLALGRQDRARRQIARGLRVTRGTDRSALTSDERLRLDRLEAQLADHEEALRRHELRLARLEADRKAGARQRSSDEIRRDERVERLEEALRRMGVDLAEAG